MYIWNVSDDILCQFFYIYSILYFTKLHVLVNQYKLNSKNSTYFKDVIFF